MNEVQSKLHMEPYFCVSWCVLASSLRVEQDDIHETCTIRPRTAGIVGYSHLYIHSGGAWLTVHSIIPSSTASTKHPRHKMATWSNGMTSESCQTLRLVNSFEIAWPIRRALCVCIWECVWVCVMDLGQTEWKGGLQAAQLLCQR